MNNFSFLELDELRNVSDIIISFFLICISPLFRSFVVYHSLHSILLIVLCDKLSFFFVNNTKFYLLILFIYSSKINALKIFHCITFSGSVFFFTCIPHSYKANLIIKKKLIDVKNKLITFYVLFFCFIFEEILFVTVYIKTYTVFNLSFSSLRNIH
jgi:hypothetical protein